MKKVHWLTWLIITLVAVAAVLLGACAKNQPDIPSRDPLPCSSYWSPDGQWRDSDGEVVDEDPCDGVDSKKPSPKQSKPVVRKSTVPAPRVTRR